ncbi:MAG: hypothetical protein M3Y75_00275 [Actinomycetota bacterium]|nr:hypothetical protein [Actinomycetota bacterium]
MAGRIPIALVCLFALTASSAQAGTLSAGPSGTKVFSEPEGAVTQNSVEVINSGGHAIRDNNAPITIAPGTGCTKEGTIPAGEFVFCSSVTGFTLNLGGGNDTLNKSLSAPPAAVPLLVDGGVGADALAGGTSGGDLVTYQGRSLGVSVDLGGPGKDDGSSEDGAPGARDEIDSSTIEGVIGGAGLDTLEAGATPAILRGEAGEDELLGGEAEDVLDGGPEADRLNARGGPDLVNGGAGIDSVEARDGASDEVDCGPDGDFAQADPVDVLVSCEPPSTLPPPPAAPAPPPALLPVLRDVTPPETTIKRKPPKQTQKRKVSFAFAATEPGSRFECKLDKRPWRSCGASASFAGLKPGAHLLRVRAVDAAGNADRTPARYGFKVLP